MLDRVEEGRGGSKEKVESANRSSGFKLRLRWEQRARRTTQPPSPYHLTRLSARGYGRERDDLAKEACDWSNADVGSIASSDFFSNRQLRGTAGLG